MNDHEPVVEDVAYKINLAGREHLLSPAWDTVHIWYGLGHAALKEMGTEGELIEVWMKEDLALPLADELGLGIASRVSISESENERRLEWLASFSIDHLDFEVTDGN